MVTIEIKYTNNYGQTYDAPEEIIGETAEDCYRQFYEKNRHLRYCNGMSYQLCSEKDKAAYRAWYDSLSESERFSMYYGNGVVD